MPLQVAPTAHMELKVIENRPRAFAATPPRADRNRPNWERAPWCACRCSSTKARLLHIDTRTGEYLSRGKGQPPAAADFPRRKASVPSKSQVHGH